MAVKLNRSAYDFAQQLVRQGQVVIDDKDAWSEHQPSTGRENDFLEQNGFRDYRRWYLGTDDEYPEETKSHYKFPYGDFEKVHRCGVISAETRAAQRGYDDIASAAAHLHGMLDAER